MDISKEKYLIGMVDDNDYKLANTPKAVAEFICKHGRNGNLVVATPDFEKVLNTFGVFVDRCHDKEFMERLRPILMPMQHDIERELGLRHHECDEKYDENLNEEGLNLQ